MRTDQLNNEPGELTTSLNFPVNDAAGTVAEEQEDDDFHYAEIIPDEDGTEDEGDGESSKSGDLDVEDDLDDTDTVSPDEALNEDDALENEPLDEEV
jgi:hypothetical protein